MEFRQKDTKTFVKRAIQRTFYKYGHTRNYINIDYNEAIAEINNALISENPIMIARFGSTELQCLAAYLREIDFLKGNRIYQKYHWDDVMHNMHYLSGFFPENDKQNLIEFCKLLIRDSEEVDILGSWRKEEFYMRPYLKKALRVDLNCLEPYFSSDPWSKYLKGKKVLVVHPFINTIKSQYKKRDLLFKNQDILPDFRMTTVRAVQTIAGNTDPRFKTWFEALNFMKSEIDHADYDVALIGCGAYGFPLAAHVKRMGKKAIHMGGALQILFGIWGKRWESKSKFIELMNKHWIYPLDEDTPKNHKKVENGCYWA